MHLRYKVYTYVPIVFKLKSWMIFCAITSIRCVHALLCMLFYCLYAEDMSVIDFEYAGPNYLAYDIGNHFCEFAGIDNVDYDLYPSEVIQKEWLRSYLEEAATIRG